jgi:serine/threonine-protein kinase RsbT
MATLERVLHRHLSALNARLVSDRGRRLLRDPQHPEGDELPRLLEVVRGAAGLFLAREQVAVLMAELEPLLPGGRSLRREVTVRIEDDVRVARLAARELAEHLGAGALFAQKLATAASELSRNIVSYTRGGALHISFDRGPPRRVRLVASDHGPGISNIDEILEGRYRSRTGLGKGLLGVRKLMDTFAISTGPAGTQVTTEVCLP